MNCRQHFGRRHGNQGKRVVILEHAEGPRWPLPSAFEVGDVNLFAAGVKNDRAGKPADGNQAEQFGFARVELKNGNGVLRAIADKKFLAGFVKRQRVRLRAEQVARILPRANRFHDLVRARVNDAQRVAARVGHNQIISVGRQRQRAGVQAGENSSACRIGRRSRRSITETEPSLAMERTGSTRTRVPCPAGPVKLSAAGRRPPQLLT